MPWSNNYTARNIAESKVSDILTTRGWNQADISTALDYRKIEDSKELPKDLKDSYEIFFLQTLKFLCSP